MSRTVSARIPKELHEELRERCNKVGCSINDFLEASVEFVLTGHSDFDFGDEEVEHIKQDTGTSEKPKTLKEMLEKMKEKPKENHEGKRPVIHLYEKDGKLVQGETTWEEKSKTEENTNKSS